MTDSELNEKLNNDFRAFRIEHDNRIAQKYVVQIPGKGLSEENFTPQEKNKLKSLTGGADIDTSQFATKDELQTALDNATVDTSQFATKTELQTAIDNVTIDTSPLATKTELQTAISNVAIDSLSSNDVYIPAATYNDIMWEFNVASTSADVNLTEFLTVWTGKVVERLNTVPMGEYTAEDLRNAALNVSQASRALISDDLYVPTQEDLTFESTSFVEELLQEMQSVVPGTFITTAPLAYNCDTVYSDENITVAIKMADVFLQYLKANNIVPTAMYLGWQDNACEITDDNLAWLNVIANGSFEKLTENNLADATELYACCRQINYIMANMSSSISFENCVIDGLIIFAVV